MEGRGLTYVGVDIKPKEKPKTSRVLKAKTEEAALCLLHQGHLLCARRYFQVKQAQQWTLVLSTRLPGETALFDTTKRALAVQTGLHWKDVENNLLHAPVSIGIIREHYSIRGRG